MFYIANTAKIANLDWRVWHSNERGSKKVYQKLCFKCLGDFNLSAVHESHYKLSGGTFRCPALSCVCWMSFESYIKRECCDAARSKRIDELFSEIAKELKNVKTSCPSKIYLLKSFYSIII